MRTRRPRLYELTGAMTSAAGMPAYEISNHARPGTRAATTSLTGATRIMRASARARTAAVSACARYATASRRISWPRCARNGHGIAEEAPLSAGEAADEALVMGLRLSEGIDAGRDRPPLRPRRDRRLERVDRLVGRVIWSATAAASR